MKQRFIAFLLLVATIFVFFNVILGQKDDGSIREDAPLMDQSGSQFYYNEEMNPFYPDFAPYRKKSSGYVVGNCTWYAWGRACEILGKKPEHVFTGNASEWWAKNKKEGYYPSGQTPKRGAILCYKTHVAIVEQAEPLIVSESGWKVKKKKEPIDFNCGQPWRKSEKPLGYIYIK